MHSSHTALFSDFDSTFSMKFHIADCIVFSIPNMLASRIVLNAHAYYHECDHSTSIQSGGEASRELEFSRFVGGIGAPMRSRLYGDDLEAETEGAEVVSDTNIIDESDTSDIARREMSMDSGPISVSDLASSWSFEAESDLLHD